MKWITQSPLSLERAAACWLITRFIDSQPDILLVPEEKLDEKIQETMAVAFDIEGVELTYSPKESTFQRILFAYRFTNPALYEMGKDLRNFSLIELFKKSDLHSFSLEKKYNDDQALLADSYLLYDALYATYQKKNLEGALLHPIDVTKVL